MTRTVAAREGAGVVQVEGELISTHQVGAYRHLTIVAPGLPELARPGQLVALAVGDVHPATPLRRGCFVHRVRPAGSYGGTVEVVVAAQDPGTEQLAGLPTGSMVGVIGPLGRPFPVPKQPVPCVLVGDGDGSAPLFWLADVLRGRGCHVEMVLAAASADRVFGLVEARRSADGVSVTTGDGSAGTRGSVSDVLPEIITRSGAGVVYGCGPLGTLRALHEVAQAHGVVAQVAVAGAVPCGAGTCMACALPVRDAHGVTSMVRTCAEGPVFRSDRVRWDALEDGRCHVPDDAVGAPRPVTR